MANKLSASSKSSMLTRIITAIVLVAVLVPCLILGGWFYFVLGMFLLVVGTHEILMVPGKDKYSLLIKIITQAYAILFALSFFIKPWAKGLNPFQLDMSLMTLSFTDLLLPISLMFFYFFVLFFIAILSEKVKLEDVTYLFAIETFFICGIVSLFFVRYLPNATGILGNTSAFKDGFASANKDQRWASCVFLLVLAIGTWSSDIGAYFVGVLFGKHPMNPRISPHKTWEGFIGGCVFSYLCYFGLAALFEFAFKIPLIPGLIQYSSSSLLSAMNVLGGSSWVFLTIIGLLLPFTGNLGGFLFSLIKRHYAIKDYGKIFPGHGGVIDRFDSLLTNARIASLLLSFMSVGFNLVA